MKTFLIGFLLACQTMLGSDIAVVTVAIGEEYRSVIAPCIENKRAYCRKHGYDFICLEESLDTSRHPAWQKILLCKQALSDNKYKWVFWSDADSLFMNFAIRLEEFIDDDYNFIVCREQDITTGKPVINTGQFFIKNSPWSIGFLEDVYAQEQFRDEYGWWEQAAVMELLKTRPDYQDHAKVVPTRLFNSMHSGWRPGLTQTYQAGDFILHFIGMKNPALLMMEIQRHKKKVIDSKEAISLDFYLGMYGYELSPLHSEINEGYITKMQRQQMQEFLFSLSDVRDILEIGFNAGHSADLFLRSFPEAHLTSVDIGTHPYTAPGVEYFTRKYKDAFTFLAGKSQEVLPGVKGQFDLIYIDGGHSFPVVLQDIYDCRALARQGAYIILDDYELPEVRAAIDCAVQENVITISEPYVSSDPCGRRAWVIGRYR